MDTESISPGYLYKYEDYEQYVIYDRNARIQIEFHSKEYKPLGHISTLEYYFLSDSLFNAFSFKDYDEEFVVDFFNREGNGKYLLKELRLDFGKEIILANVVHITRDNKGRVDFAHVYTYQFYDKNTFNEYGYGWTPGQPQMGYIYKMATDIPKNVMIEIQKINGSKFKTVNKRKSPIFSESAKETKMFLIKGDIIQILEDKDNWLRIRYYGKETIEGWIRKEDVE